MSRHRNVRSMRYSDEYDGYDDVYGHSVEEDHAMSPSDAAFMYDRSLQPQVSSFLPDDSSIAEECETFEEDDASPQVPTQAVDRGGLNESERVKLTTCLDDVRNVLGEAIPESKLIDAIIAVKFDTEKALDRLLSAAEEVAVQRELVTESPKLRRGIAPKTEKALRVQDIPSPVITIASSPARRQKVVKGFNVTGASNVENLEVSGNATPARSESPFDGNNSFKTKSDSFVPSKRDNADEIFKKERGDLKDQLHLVVIGHVDAGKSTLMGHLLYKLGHVTSKTMHKFEQESKKIGKQSFIYAWVLDETGEERSRGITMDVGQSKFETKTKMITLLDAPGHKDFIPNMITGASQADVALLVVDSTRGEFETGFESGGQTREHALLIRSLGVSQLGVAVNKLDTVGWSKERFQDISEKLGTFLKQAGFKEKDVTFVPCSGLTGENLTEKSTNAELIKWYGGPTLLEVIDKFQSPVRPVSNPLRIFVNDVFKGTGSGFCVSGRVETGMVQAGSRVLVSPQNEMATVKAINRDDLPSPTAFAGDYVSLTLSNIDQQNIAIGYVLCDPAFPVPVSSKFEARIVIFNVTVPITRGFQAVLHIQCLSEQAVITKIVSQLNKNTGEEVKKRPRCLLKNSNAIVVIETSRPICLEQYKDMKELGRFMLRVGGATIAAGLVIRIL